MEKVESNTLVQRKNKEIKDNDAKENIPGETKKDGSKNFRYGPMPTFPSQRMWSRSIIIVCVMVYIWYTSVMKSGKEISLAKQKEMFETRAQTVKCDDAYLSELKQFPACVPKKCGRFITDHLITTEEADVLLKVAQKGMVFGGSNGGASILDLHSGALSLKEKFVNIYSLPEAKKFIDPSDIVTYTMVKSKIQHAIAQRFNIDEKSLHLTHPTFFSRLTALEPKTPHDEYWHIHVDQDTYESFHYTSLLYLTDYGVDFKGGRFIFVDDAVKPLNNVTIEPKKGRVSFFTSGAENPHFVEPVTEGARYAITISFTCDKKAAIKTPTIK